MNAPTTPMNGTPLAAIVLPIGVLQQLAYQRTSPFSVRRIAAILSVPAVKRTFAGDICTTSVPPCASRMSSARPR